MAPEQRQQLVNCLVQARRAVGQVLRASDAAALRDARDQVEAAKAGLGERGLVWWTDGAPEYNRHLVKNTPYAQSLIGVSVPTRYRWLPAPTRT